MTLRNKLILGAQIALIILLILALAAVIMHFIDSRVAYPVVESDDSMKLDTNATLYVATIPYNEKIPETTPHIYFFRGKEDKKIDVFYNPEFIGETLVVERFVNVFHSSYYTSSNIPSIFDPMFKLANKTSEDNPLKLLYKDDILYGFIDDTAYLILDQRQILSETATATDIPDEILVGTLRNLKKQIVYKMEYDGEYSVLETDEDSIIPFKF